MSFVCACMVRKVEASYINYFFQSSLKTCSLVYQLAIFLSFIIRLRWSYAYGVPALPFCCLFFPQPTHRFLDGCCCDCHHCCLCYSFSQNYYVLQFAHFTFHVLHKCCCLFLPRFWVKNMHRENKQLHFLIFKHLHIYLVIHFQKKKKFTLQFDKLYFVHLYTNTHA